jgi:hypothetical protein
MIAVMKKAVILKMWSYLCLVSLPRSTEGMPKCTDVFGRERAVQFPLPPSLIQLWCHFSACTQYFFMKICFFMSNFNQNFSDNPKYEIFRKPIRWEFRLYMRTARRITMRRQAVSIALLRLDVRLPKTAWDYCLLGSGSEWYGRRVPTFQVILFPPLSGYVKQWFISTRLYGVTF